MKVLKYMVAADDLGIMSMLRKGVNYVRPHVMPVLKTLATTFGGPMAGKAVDLVDEYVDKYIVPKSNTSLVNNYHQV